MPELTKTSPSGDFVTITAHFKGTGVTIEEHYPNHLSAHLKTVAINTMIRKLMELYIERLSS